MIIRVNFGFHDVSYGAPAPAFSISRGGFGPLYNVASPAKQVRPGLATVGPFRLGPPTYLLMPAAGPIWGQQVAGQIS
jgi:hypothetical protein